MVFLGLSGLQVLALCGAAGAAVFVLYLLKLRRRQVHVPFVKLWEEVLAEKQTTRLFAQLKRWISFLVALLIVCLLAFATGDPRLATARTGARTLVILVDASASMQATDEKPTRFVRATERVREIIAGLGPADRALIAQMDTTTAPVSPLSDDPRILRDSLSLLRPTDTSADLDAGIALALDVLRGEPEPEIVVVSDGQVAPAANALERLSRERARVSFVRVGSEKANVGLTAFSVRRYPLDKSHAEVLVELWNPGPRDEEVELTLLGDGAPVEVQKLPVKAGGRTRRFFTNISGVDKTLEARIRRAAGSADALPVDDRAFAMIPERRRARILAVTRDNLYLEAALLLDEYLEVFQVSPEQYESADGFDVAIFDGFVPAAPPRTDAIYLHPATAAGGFAPVAVKGALERPFLDRLDRKHPLLRWTSLADVNIADALLVTPEPGDAVVAADSRGPLILAGTRGSHRAVIVAFDVRRSDWPLRVAWPLFLLNSIDWFVEEAGGVPSSYRTGETWRVPLPEETTRAQIAEPDGTPRDVPVVDGRAVFRGSRAGFHTVRAFHEDRLIDERTFAANLGLNDETAIAPATELRLGSRAAGTVTEGRIGVRRELWLYIVAFVLLALTFEWLSYHRRWTV